MPTTSETRAFARWSLNAMVHISPNNIGHTNLDLKTKLVNTLSQERDAKLKALILCWSTQENNLQTIWNLNDNKEKQHSRCYFTKLEQMNWDNTNLQTPEYITVWYGRASTSYRPTTNIKCILNNIKYYVTNI